LRKLVITLGALALAALILYAAREPLLRGAAHLLRVYAARPGADALVVLSGNANVRPQAGAHLYHRGYAPLVVITRTPPEPVQEMGIVPSEAAVALEVLRRLEVPRSAVTVVPEGGTVSSTIGEARALYAWARARDIRRLTLVTTSYHTSRALWAFRRVFADTDVALDAHAADHYLFTEANWWRVEDGLIAIFNEYVKWGYYLWQYGLGSPQSASP